MMQAEMVNYKNTEQNVYIIVDLEYEKGQVGREVRHGTLSATGKILILFIAIDHFS